MVSRSTSNNADTLPDLWRLSTNTNLFPEDELVLSATVVINCDFCNVGGCETGGMASCIKALTSSACNTNCTNIS